MTNIEILEEMRKSAWYWSHFTAGYMGINDNEVTAEMRQEVKEILEKRAWEEMTHSPPVQTTPEEYGKQIRRILELNPMMTIAELSKRIARSPKWIYDHLDIECAKDLATKVLTDPKRLGKAPFRVLIDNEVVNITSLDVTLDLKEYLYQSNDLCFDKKCDRCQGKFVLKETGICSKCKWDSVTGRYT